MFYGNRLLLMNRPAMAVVLTLLLGYLVVGEFEKRSLKSEGIEKARVGCAERLGAEICEEHLRRHARECFRQNYVSSGGGRYSGPRVHTLHQKPFEDCLVMTPVVWREADRQARREAARQAAQQRGF